MNVPPCSTPLKLPALAFAFLMQADKGQTGQKLPGTQTGAIKGGCCVFVVCSNSKPKASLLLWLRDVRELLALLLFYINIFLGFGFSLIEIEGKRLGVSNLFCRPLELQGCCPAGPVGSPPNNSSI